MRGSQRTKALALAALGLGLLCWCAALFSQNAPQESTPAAATGPFRIAGTVVSAASGAPLARARVTLADTKNGRDSQSIVTGEGGHFEFDHLNAGKYALQGARRGFINASYEQHGQFSTAIVTGAGLDTENLTLRLEPTATITGKILDESGEAVRKARVSLYRENRALGVRQIAHASSAQTDDLGNYEFASIVPGTYYISASAQPWYALHPSSIPAEGEKSAPPVNDSLDVAYLTTFYPSVTDWEDASPIAVKGGEHAQIDLQLEPVPALHLIFHAGDRQHGIPPIRLIQRVFDSVEDNIAIDIQQMANGTAELAGVPAGTYTVETGGFNSGEAARRTEIKVMRSGDEVDSSGAEPVGSLRLAVKIAGEQNLPPQLVIALRDDKLQNRGARDVDSNGEVTFPNLPAGKYTVLARSQDKLYSVLRTSSAGTEISGNRVELAPGAALSISALLSGDTARVEGFVTLSGKPAPGVMVVLVPEKPESNVELFRRDQSDSDGSFTLREVVPGSYTAIAIEDGWTLEWSRPAVLARYAPRGQKVTVGPQIHSPIKLPEPLEAQPR